MEYHTLHLLILDSSPDPIERMGLINPTLDNLRALACTFSGYHAVIRSDRLTEPGAPPNRPLGLWLPASSRKPFSQKLWKSAYSFEVLQLYFEPLDE